MPLAVQPGFGIIRLMAVLIHASTAQAHAACEEEFDIMRTISSICVVASLLVTSTAWAQNSPASDATSQDQPTLQSVQQELNKLRSENQAMKNQIDDLRAKTDADWLTQQRATEIKGLVQDVLADADQRASLLQEGITAGWSDHFFLASPDGRFSLILEGMEQIRWIYNYHDQPDRHRHGFENTRTRLTFRGHVFSQDIEYLVRGEFSRSGGTFSLLDSWVRYNLNEEWSVRFGQFKLPFEREELVSEAEQLAVERSLVGALFSLGRTQGIDLTYTGRTSRFTAAYSEGASTASPFSTGQSTLIGAPRINTSALTEGTEYAVTARYEFLAAGTWDQFSDFTSPVGDEFGMMFGLAGHVQRSEANNQLSFGRNESSFGAYTVDGSFEFGGANAFIAFTHFYIDSPSVIINGFGIVAQAGVYVTPKWEVFIRGEYGAFRFNNSMISDLNLVTAGVNYYIDGHDLKWTTDLSVGLYQIEGVFANDTAGFRADANGVDPQIVFRTQFQLLF